MGCSGDQRVSAALHYMCLSTHIIFIAELEEFMQILDQCHEAKAKKGKGTMKMTM